MSDIEKPTLLLNEEICKANIRRMAEKARANDLQLKPHMKTHQSAEIGEWLREAGVSSITVSSVDMAEYFAKHGWDDITIAFPCNIRQADPINRLAQSTDLTLLVNSLYSAEQLSQRLANPVQVYIEIDTGSERTGLKVSQIRDIKNLITKLNTAQNIEWIGFYSHPGHSYSSRSKDEIKQVHQSVIQQFQELRKKLEPEFGPFRVCVGDTPCCSIGREFTGIDAISPGNFIFYDLMQCHIGSCQVRDIAVAMACPIVEKNADRNELAIYGGAIHFSKEALENQNVTHFGKVAISESDHWEIPNEHTYLKRLSQEHGIIACSDKQVFDSYQVGDLITILPVHSCLTANLMKRYWLDNGKTISQL